MVNRVLAQPIELPQPCPASAQRPRVARQASAAGINTGDLSQSPLNTGDEVEMLCGSDQRHGRKAAPHHEKRYSITSLARIINASGTVSPSAFAVLRLRMRSNLIGCSTGMSAGFAPRKILST